MVQVLLSELSDVTSLLAVCDIAADWLGLSISEARSMPFSFAFRFIAMASKKLFKPHALSKGRQIVADKVRIRRTSLTVRLFQLRRA
jgi:hypothetical protein